MLEADKTRADELSLKQKASLQAVAELKAQQSLSDAQIEKAEAAWTKASLEVSKRTLSLQSEMIERALAVRI